jgi:hypothetical protein
MLTYRVWAHLRSSVLVCSTLAYDNRVIVRARSCCYGSHNRSAIKSSCGG